MHVVRAFFGRLGRKLVSVAPVALASALIFAALWLAAYLGKPYLPEDWRHVLAQFERGDFEQARDELKALLESAGVGVELAFIGFQVLQVLFAPVPGQVAGLLGGYLFGFWYGLLLTMTGLAVGSLLAMGAGRLLGKHVVRRFVPGRFTAKFDVLVGKDGLWNFFLIFLLPVFPDDAACLLAGLTRLSLWKLVLVCLVGRLPGMAVLTYVGAGAGEGRRAAYVVLGVSVALAFVVWLYSEELEKWFLRHYRRRRGREATGAS